MNVTEKIKGTSIQQTDYVNLNFLTEGAFTLTFQANTSQSLAWNAARSEVVNALAALDSIGADIGGTGYILWQHSLTTASAQITSDPPGMTEENVPYEIRAEVQTIILTTTAIAGLYRLTYAGQITTAIDWNANAATVQTALQALTTIGADQILVDDADGGFDATFADTLAGLDLDLITADDYTVSAADISGYIAEVQAAQLATDQAAVLAAAANILEGHSILDQAGAYDLDANLAAAAIDQLETDEAAVLAAAASILDTATILGQDGTYDAATAIAAQLETDQAAVLAAAEFILDTATILGQDGTFDLAADEAAAAAEQLATDQAAVLAAAEFILLGHSILDQPGTLQGGEQTMTIKEDFAELYANLRATLLAKLARGDQLSGPGMQALATLMLACTQDGLVEEPE